MTGLYECHGHLMMDGEDYMQARRRHRNDVDLATVHSYLAALRAHGVRYFRDGGDALGVSAKAREIAPDYGIEYATPLFAIHRKGYYGGIVGRGYGDLREYRALVAEAKAQGCDFIKLMFSGILTFTEWGGLSCPGLPPEEIIELVRIAHGEGFAVMAHVNGPETVRAAIEAGTDSIEHGYFMDEACLRTLADSGSFWVPTLAATAAFVGRPGFDCAVAEETQRRQKEALRSALAHGVAVAVGSDSGAVGVPHGPGTTEEYRLLTEDCGATVAQLQRANEALRRRFRRQ